MSERGSDGACEDRCRGDCCRRIYLAYNTREEIAACGDPDAKQLSEMLVPLEDQFLAPDGLPVSLRKGLFFTCKNLLENGDCGIYETRPGMCRRYPDGYQCPVPTCRSKEARSLPIHQNRPSRKARRLYAQAAKTDRLRPHRGLAIWNEAERKAGRT